jgi:hypothetical protein
LPGRAVSALQGKAFISAQDAVAWFLRDMADVSGYLGDNGVRSPLAGYALFRPVLTAPDPWYFAGIVALESCKICDLFPTEQADEILREVFATMDKAIGREDNDASSLAIMIMGRLGMGSLILHRKVPDNLLAKVMMILLGSASSAASVMPDDTAHEQIRKALRLGKPVWWTMFARRYEIDAAAPPVPKLVPSVYAANDG